MILLITAKVIPRYPGKAERPRCIWRGLSRAPEDARTSRHTTGLASFTVNERITDANKPSPRLRSEVHENGLPTKFDHSGAEMFPNLEFKAHAWETFR
jgi:hypothetical protein